MRRAGLLLLGLALCGPAGAASVYRWVDAQGVTRYDDRNRIGGERVEREVLDRRQIPPAASAAEALDRLDAGQRCALWRERLEQYRSARDLYERDPFGNELRLSPTQTRILLARTERERQRACGAPAR